MYTVARMFILWLWTSEVILYLLWLFIWNKQSHRQYSLSRHIINILIDNKNNIFLALLNYYYYYWLLNNDIGQGVLWVFASYSQSARYTHYTTSLLVIIIIQCVLTYLSLSSLKIKSVSRSSNTVSSILRTTQDRSEHRTVVHISYTSTIMIDSSSILYTHFKVSRGRLLNNTRFKQLF